MTNLNPFFSSSSLMMSLIGIANAVHIVTGYYHLLVVNDKKPTAVVAEVRTTGSAL